MIRSALGTGSTRHVPHLISQRRDRLGMLVAVLGVVALGALMLPLRGHVSVATPALVLVLPVVAGVVTGGFPAGIVAVVFGFFTFDFVFIPPYYTLDVGSGSNWIALAVYVVVMLLVARLLAHLRETQAEANRHADVTRRILDLSDALISDRPFEEFLGRVTATFLEVFGLRSVTVLLPGKEGLHVVASAGTGLSADEIASLVAPSGAEPRPSAVHLATGANVVVPLSTSGGPVGLIVLGGARLVHYDAGLLQTYANQVALALERVQLRERAIRSQLLEEVDRWRDALIGAVSHDLRTPLAVIKAAVSDLLEEGIDLDSSARHELLSFIEDQSDRLERLVVNLLDMTRIRAGALVPQIERVVVADLVVEALAALPAEIGARVVSELSADSPVVAVDHVLIARVLANLFENADRHAPVETPIEVDAVERAGRVEVSVTDHGPGVAPEDRDRIFDMFSRVSGAGRAGLGLTIAKAFVEAHGGSIAVTSVDGGGARFTFTIAPPRT